MLFPDTGILLELRTIEDTSMIVSVVMRVILLKKVGTVRWQRSW